MKGMIYETRLKSNKIMIDIDISKSKFAKIHKYIWWFTEGKYYIDTVFFNVFVWMQKIYGVEVKNIDVCESAHGIHILIEIDKELDAEDIIMLQLAFGSDYVRELNNLYRVKLMRKEGSTMIWNVLYNHKYKVTKKGIKRVSVCRRTWLSRRIEERIWKAWFESVERVELEERADRNIY